MRTVGEQALSSMSYFFLRMIFDKEAYSESVLEELQWVVDEMVEENVPSELFAAMQQELLEGDYLLPDETEAYAEVQRKLLEEYGYDFDITESVISTLHAMYRPNRPFVVLLGVPGSGATGVAEYLKEAYGWKEAELYYDTKKTLEDREKFVYTVKPHPVMTDNAQYLDLRDDNGVWTTIEQLNDSDFCVLDPQAFDALRSQYKKRPLLNIVLTTSKEILKARMRAYSSMMDFDELIERNEKLFSSMKSDAFIDTGKLPASDAGDAIVRLLAKRERDDCACTTPVYLNVRILDIQWDVSDDDPTTMDLEEFPLPTDITVNDYFKLDDYLQHDGTIDTDELSEDVSDWLSDTYGFLHGGFKLSML